MCIQTYLVLRNSNKDKWLFLLKCGEGGAVVLFSGITERYKKKKVRKLWRLL